MEKYKTARKITSPNKLHQHFHKLGSKQVAEFINQHSGLLNQLGEVKTLIGSERNPIIHDGKDELISRVQTYGEHKKPQDYLGDFNQYIKVAVNEAAVVNRLKNLKRSELKEVKLLLDSHGFNEAKLASAWRSQTNQDIAAGIIGHIRQAAIGEALVPFESRVIKAMQVIYALQPWTPIQRKWLDRLAKQWIHEVVIDQQFINDLPAFSGGVKQLNKILDDQLDMVLDQLKGHLWAAS